MRVKPVLCLMAFAMTAARASSSGVPLAVNYSEWIDFPTDPGAAIAADNSGALYLMSGGASSSVTKVSADGRSIRWRDPLGFPAAAIAVDPSGGVYVVSARQPGNNFVYVAKLGAGGAGVAWKAAAGFSALSPPVLAVDSQGRAYVAAQFDTNNFVSDAYVVRLTADGGAVDYAASLKGTPASIAVDPSGAAFVSGTQLNAAGVYTGFLARLAPDGSAGFYTTLPVTVTQARRRCCGCRTRRSTSSRRGRSRPAAPPGSVSPTTECPRIASPGRWCKRLRPCSPWTAFTPWP